MFWVGYLKCSKDKGQKNKALIFQCDLVIAISTAIFEFMSTGEAKKQF